MCDKWSGGCRQERCGIVVIIDKSIRALMHNLHSIMARRLNNI